MRKAINVEATNNKISRVLSIADESIIGSNPTNLDYFIIEDFVEPPLLDNPLAINYPMYDNINKTFKWVQIQYQNTATEEILQIENLKIENNILNNQLKLTQLELQASNENINMLIELQADLIGGAI